MTQLDTVLESIRANAESQASLLAAIKDLKHLAGQPSHSGGNSTINVNAGGWGVAISVAACGLMLAINIMQLVDRARQDSEIRELRAADRRHDDHLSAIYMMAPHLKPKEPQK